MSLADSQVLRWIDELNGVTNADEKAKEIRSEIRKLKKEQCSLKNRKAVKKLYAMLDEIQFKPDYMCLIIDKPKDYRRACKGFSINGVKYQRLLGTVGGVKNSTIVFVSDAVVDELRKRIDNGRDKSKEVVPAKFEAYKALTCSASIPVSFPNGVIVVDDCEVTFKSDIIYLNDDGVDEPVMEYRHDEEIKSDVSDGYGLMLPSLAERWSAELGLDYTMSGCNTRFSWEKGMVFTFDFLDFAENVAHSYIVKDAWGTERDVREAELILTTSMLKMYDSYDSYESYISCCKENKYTFGVAKTCPKELENEHTLNYQFIQSYELSDDNICELIEPTVREYSDALGLDYRSSLLFMRGVNMDDANAASSPNDFIKALMIEPSIINDSYVRQKIHQAIKNKIKDAKIGVIKVHGNYSIISGDPYALCQNMFGLEVTGLLKAGEIYSEYWNSFESDRLACFRAPMSCHNNIRIMRPCKSDEAKYWFRYMKTCTVLNAWDTSCMAMNGADNDGDTVMLTDNRVLVENTKEMPALMCVQRKAKKIVPTDEDMINSNLASFGDDIGKTTNWITSMYEVKSHFDADSEQCRVLDYRIQCGQLFQQNCIDKAKGIVSKPMPRWWHDIVGAKNSENDMDIDIVADKKPYFMIYVYQPLMRQYTSYINGAKKNSIREFKITLDELLSIPEGEMTERQKEFVSFYNKLMPVGTGSCTMNRICNMFEDIFDGWSSKNKPELKFDPSVLKSGAEYSMKQYYDVFKLYGEYISRMKSYAIYTKYERVDEYDAREMMRQMKDDFVRDCLCVCSNEDVLCDIAIDICYRKNGTKSFVWDLFSDRIIHNLLSRSGGIMSFPAKDESGDIVYCGDRFKMRTIRIEGFENGCSDE